ncbi:HDOD domain-containing protein [Endothiovibrio diazotrophicus]
MTTPVELLVQGVGELVSLPEVFIRVNQAVDDPRGSAAQVGEIIAQDPGLTARLLRLANSPLYALTATVDTVARAVTVLGTQQIRALVLATSVTDTFEGLPNELVSMKNFWNHSLLCALCARALSRQARKGQPEVMFTAGLLHDIGELVIFSRLPELARKVLLLTLDSPEELAIHQAEQRVLGFDHGDVGGELAHLWQLPPILEECIRHHHAVERAEAFQAETALVHIANIAAQMAELKTLDPEQAPPISAAAWKLSGLDRAAVETAVTEAMEGIDEASKLFSPAGE